MIRVLLTGAGGQLGQEFKQLCAQEQAIELYAFTRSELDICDHQAIHEILEKHKIDFLVNAAAYTQVDLAEKESEQAIKVNANAPKILALACQKRQIKFLHISTDYVFDGAQKTAYLPSQATDPQGVYGASKLKGEQHIVDSGANAMIIRTAWVYSSFGKNFVKTMRKLGADHTELSVVADQVGSPTYAQDLAEVLIHIIIERTKINGVEIHHFTNQGTCHWADFAKEIMRLSGLDCKINEITSDQYPTPAKRPAYSVLDMKSLYLRLPQARKRSWESALADCIEVLESQ